MIGDSRRVFASRPGSLLDVGTAIGGDSGGLGSTLGLGLGSTFGSNLGSTFSGASGEGGGRNGGGNSMPPSAARPDAGHAASRSARHHHHHHAVGSGILSEFALSALSGNGGSSELSVATGGRGGGPAGGGGWASAIGARAATASASAQQALQYVAGPSPLSPATRGAAPPGSVLSSFASPASHRWACKVKRWHVAVSALAFCYLVASPAGDVLLGTLG